MSEKVGMELILTGDLGRHVVGEERIEETKAIHKHRVNTAVNTLRVELFHGSRSSARIKFKVTDEEILFDSLTLQIQEGEDLASIDTYQYEHETLVEKIAEVKESDQT